jgi:hypothetical protein
MPSPNASPLELSDDDRWFVYLLASTDCSAFKAGFTCNPLQRLYSFSHRYYEHFDLPASCLLQVETNSNARTLEGEIKQAFAAHRIECPSWVSPQAGGETEWFSAIYFADAQARLQAYGTEILNLEDFVRESLERATPYFESWALAQAHSILRPRSPRERSLIATDVRTLRDWLDAYRALNVTVFSDNLDARALLAHVLRR